MIKGLAQANKRMWFKNPPIVEAVIALEIAMLPDTAVSAFHGCSARMNSIGYSQVEPVWQHQVHIKFENGLSSSGEDRAIQLGLKFRNDAAFYAVQFNRNGMVFSRLGKYESWAEFRSEAEKLWEVYSGAVMPPAILRIGVRYINKLFIPLNEPAEEYVTVWPHLPEGIVQRIDAMQMQLALPILEPEGRLVHTQILLPPEKEGFAALLFDNDFQFDTSQKETRAVWQMLEAVRDVKDHYFERFTTDKMRETFDA